MKKKNKKKSKVISNIVFNVIALISTILAVVFCVYLYKLDMLPMKYLSIVFIGLGVFYLVLLVLTLPRHMKTWIKGVCCFFFIGIKKAPEGAFVIFLLYNFLRILIRYLSYMEIIFHIPFDGNH